MDGEKEGLSPVTHGAERPLPHGGETNMSDESLNELLAEALEQALKTRTRRLVATMQGMAIGIASLVTLFDESGALSRDAVIDTFERQMERLPEAVSNRDCVLGGLRLLARHVVGPQGELPEVPPELLN